MRQSALARSAPPEVPPSTPVVPRGVQPMSRNDLDDVGRLFNLAFRKVSKPPSRELVAYLDHVFFTSPGYREEAGSLVHRNAAGRIDSAVLALPMSFEVDGRKITARLLCAFMADGRSGLAGAARIARAIRLSNPEFCFSDNSSPVSADHWTVGGGSVLPIQSLEWRRTFRPAAAAIERARTKLPWLNVPMLSLPAYPVDRLARRMMPSLRAEPDIDARWVAADARTFLRSFRTMTRRFSLRPSWSGREFRWLMENAAANPAQGTLTGKILLDRRDEEIGACLYLHKPRGTAHVLNVLSEPGREVEVARALFAELEASGHVAARGMAQPFLMNALLRSGRTSFVSRGYFCMTTDREDVREAVLRNDLYVGGLASESWSRLVTDFR